ncbi:MAG: transcription antitermination factor NusB [Elusimicrobiota bacterium]|jgi:transcription antitermination factor NusB|nr:transcription antitermination factor NusB [Elusimicrobiota bacterium]
MSKRRLAREYALQTLYFTDTGKLTAGDSALFANTFFNNLDEDTFTFCKDLVTGTNANIAHIDVIVAGKAKNWSLPRMSAVDRAILRMATYEIVFSADRAPVPAIIDEAIELAKKYSTENSGKFINGLLDQIKKERKPDGKKN